MSYRDVPPEVLYTDRDCFSSNGSSSKYHHLFEEWGEGLYVRLDIWHFMRRLAGGVTSESHPLYGTFMSQLSTAIFEWDMGDITHLTEAKKGELVSLGVSRPTNAAARKATTKEELLKHCRRRTRGVGGNHHCYRTTSALTLICYRYPGGASSEAGAHYHLKKHIPCIQDLPGITLYTVVGHLVKGGVRLQVLRCARGSTGTSTWHRQCSQVPPRWHH